MKMAEHEEMREGQVEIPRVVYEGKDEELKEQVNK